MEIELKGYDRHVMTWVNAIVTRAVRSGTSVGRLRVEMSADVWEQMVAEDGTSCAAVERADIATPCGTVLAMRMDHMKPRTIRLMTVVGEWTMPPRRRPPLVPSDRLMDVLDALNRAGHSPSAALAIAEQLCLGVEIDDAVG